MLSDTVDILWGYGWEHSRILYPAKLSNIIKTIKSHCSICVDLNTVTTMGLLDKNLQMVKSRQLSNKSRYRTQEW